MQISQALALLEISAQSSVNERKQAFEVKRDKLEGQIAQSPTPALKEKFREKLDELKGAYNFIEQEFSSDELPVASEKNNNEPYKPSHVGSASFEDEHRWKLKIMDELDERFGKTLNSSQLQGYLTSCAPQQNLDYLIPLAQEKQLRYGKEPLDNEYYKYPKFIQAPLFALTGVSRKDNAVYRKLMHQNSLDGIDALAVLCAEKPNFVTPVQQANLSKKRKNILRIFPIFIGLLVLTISIWQYIQHVENKKIITAKISDAKVLAKNGDLNLARQYIESASSKGASKSTIQNARYQIDKIEVSIHVEKINEYISQNNYRKAKSELKDAKSIGSFSNSQELLALDKKISDAEYKQKQAIETQRKEKKELGRLAKKYGENVGRQVMDKMGGGQDLNVRIKNWNYDNYANRLEVKIEIFWNGSLWRSNNYNIDGILKVDKSGHNPSFIRTYANQNVKDIDEMYMWAGAIVELGKLSSQ